MYILLKHGGKQELAFNDLLEKIPVNYIFSDDDETQTFGEMLVVENGEVVHTLFPQTPEEIENVVYPVLLGEPAAVFIFECDKDDHPGLKKSGVFDIGDNIMIFAGTYMESSHKHFQDLPTDWQNYPGLRELVSKKIWSSEAVYGICPEQNKIFVYSKNKDDAKKINDTVYEKLIEYKTPTYRSHASKESYNTSFDNVFCALHRDYLKKGEIFVEIDTAKFGNSFSSMKLTFCKVCFDKLRNTPNKKLDFKTVIG